MILNKGILNDENDPESVNIIMMAGVEKLKRQLAQLNSRQHNCCLQLYCVASFTTGLLVGGSEL